MSKEINSHSSGVGMKATANLSDAVSAASAVLSSSVTIGFVFIFNLYCLIMILDTVLSLVKLDI